MNAPELETAVREAISHWSRLTDLVDFALRRCSFGDSDGGFGVNYPEALDDYDRQVDGCHIPEGHLQVYGFWGPPEGYEVIVPESLYLRTLAAVLDEAGLLPEAARVRGLFGEK